MIYCIQLASIPWIWSAVIYEIYDNPIITTLKNPAIVNVSIDTYIWNVCKYIEKVMENCKLLNCEI